MLKPRSKKSATEPVVEPPTVNLAASVPEMKPVRLMDRDEVAAALHISAGTLYGLIRAKKFPQPVHPAPRTSRWLETDVVAYQQAILEQRTVRAA